MRKYYAAERPDENYGGQPQPTPQQVKELAEEMKEKYWSPFVEQLWAEKLELKHEAVRFIREKLFEPLITEIYNYKPKEVVGEEWQKLAIEFLQWAKGTDLFYEYCWEKKRISPEDLLNQLKP